MYIAICIMLAGMLFGRLSKNIKFFDLCRYLNMPAILILLFLLGVSIGKNREIVNALPILGGKAILLTLCGMTGSILCLCCISPILKNLFSRKKSDD